MSYLRSLVKSGQDGLHPRARTDPPADPGLAGRAATGLRQLPSNDLALLYVGAVDESSIWRKFAMGQPNQIGGGVQTIRWSSTLRTPGTFSAAIRSARRSSSVRTVPCR